MAKRNLKQYFQISRSTYANERATRANPYEIPKDPSKSSEVKEDLSALTKAGKTIERYFRNSILWLKDFWVHKSYEYPSSIDNPPALLQSSSGNPITIAIAADWANNTSQSEFIGNCIREKGPNKTAPDYTIHLGDTYYCGSDEELAACFGRGNSDDGIWPRGSKGTFVLAGNHEMFSSGRPYYNLIKATNRNLGINNQGHEPVFCLQTEHWCILGLDTGYDSLKHGLIPIHIHPDKLNLELKQSVIDWLIKKVNIKSNKRGIIVLTHHPNSSAFHGEHEFKNPASQLHELLPGREVIWIWGHEHRFSMYGKFSHSETSISTYARCIGNGGMPDEHSKRRYLDEKLAKSRNLEIYDKRTADTFLKKPGAICGKDLDIGYNGYAVISLEHEEATIDYYASYQGDEHIRHRIHPHVGSGIDEKVFTEKWISDGSGKINRTLAKDHTEGRKEGLTHWSTKP